MKLGDLLKRVYRSRLGMSQKAQPPAGSRAHFVLLYDGLKVGNLSVDRRHWRFSYTDEFRSRLDLRALTEFPDTSREYESVELCRSSRRESRA
jgi:hypothetical protein